MTLTNIKAAIFDLDGTLLDTIEDIADSMNCVLESRGYPSFSTKVYRDFIGDGLDTLVRRALPESKRDEASVDGALNEMRKIYACKYANKTTPFEGIAELLKELQKRNIRLAVLSNKLDEFTKIMTAKYFPALPFELVWGARKNIPLKPSPVAVMEITQQMDVLPAQTIFVGDSHNDMLTARNSGCVAIGVSWGYGTVEELETNGAQYIIRRPAELLKLFS